jgi:hypothetical protein
MVPKDSTARTGADLNGQIVAINGLKDLTQFTTAAWIDKNGGDVRTVRVGCKTGGASTWERRRRGWR